MKLIEALEIFLGEYKPATAETYSYILNRCVEWIGNREPSEVEGVELVRYVQSIDKKLAESTLEKHKKSIKTFFYWLERVGLIEGTNPAKAIKQKRISNKVRKDKAMTDEELFKLLDYLKWFPRNHAMVLFLAQTGCRAGGVSTLAIEHVDFETLVASVTEKGDKTRTVAFDEECATAIRTWLVKRPKTDNDFVFVTDEGKQMSSAIISQTIRRACLKIGLRSLGAHSLRHRLGHRFADARIAPPIAASYLGHKDVAITLNHYYPDSWQNDAALIRELIQTPNTKETKTIIHSIHRKTGSE